MAHSEGHGFDELLAARGTFEVVVEVQDNEAGNGFVAHAKAVGYENDEVVARAEAPDAASAFKGAASAMGQVIARRELAARLRQLDQFLGGEEDLPTP